MPLVTPANLNAPQKVGAGPMPVAPKLVSQEPQAQGQTPDLRQTDTSEKSTQASAEETKTPQAPVDPLAPKFAALAKKEQALRAQMRAMEAKEQAIKANEAEIEKAKAWQAKLTQDPWSVLMEAGLSPERATEIILNQPKPEDLKYSQIQSELQALKQAQEQAQKNAEAQRQQQYEQAKKQIGNEVKALVETDSNFETVKAMDAHDAVVELIESVFNEDGYLMPVHEATQAVEDYLAEEALKLAQLKKIQSKLNVPPAQPQAEKSVAPQNQKSPIQTLTNRVTQSSTKPLSSKDRRERAIKAFMGQLTE
jgi:hypothetical protein